MSNHRIPSSEKLHVEHLERKYPRRFFSQDLDSISKNNNSVVACVSCGTPIHTKSKASLKSGCSAVAALKKLGASHLRRVEIIALS